MTMDEMQLLRDFRKDIPLPDDETMRRAYAYATSGLRAGFPQSLRFRGVPPLRLRFALPAAAAVCVAVACAVVFTGALGGSSPAGTKANESPGGSGGGSSALAPDPVSPSQALSDGAKSFGVPIILPDTSVLKPSDASGASEQWSPSARPGGPTSLQQVDVYFYGPPYVTIEYAPTDPSAPDAVDQYKAEIAQSSHPETDQIVYLSGTPALLDVRPFGNSIEFRLGPLSITIWAPSNNGTPTTVDGAKLQALAQSMLDQAGTASP